MLGVKLCVRDKKEAICVVYPIRSQVPWLAIIGSCNASVVLVCLSCSCYSIKTVGVGTLHLVHNQNLHLLHTSPKFALFVSVPLCANFVIYFLFNCNSLLIKHIREEQNAMPAALGIILA